MATPKPALTRSGNVRPAAKTIRSSHEQRIYYQILHAGIILVGCIMLWPSVQLRNMLPHLAGRLDSASYIACLVLLELSQCIFYIFSRVLPWNRIPYNLLRSVLLSSLVVFSVLFLNKHLRTTISRPFLLFYAIFLLLGLLAWNYSLRKYNQRLEKTYPRQVVLLGNPADCQSLYQRLNQQSGYLVLDQIFTQSGWLDQALSRLESILRSHAVDSVIMTNIFALSQEQHRFSAQLLELCAEAGIQVQFHVSWLKEHDFIYLDKIANEPVLAFSYSPVMSLEMLGKRALDIVGSLLMLLLTSPVMLAALLAVYWDSPGPLLFRQDRPGLNGRMFRIYKIRTMTVAAEHQKLDLHAQSDFSGPAFKMFHDPRVTRVGRWLRKASIDELPQLFNVLRGEMSLVGPRPCTVDEMQRFSIAHLRRHCMKPGITGLWQISGRNAIRDFEQRVALDSEYIRNWSLWLDCKIIFQTVWVVLKMSGC